MLKQAQLLSSFSLVDIAIRILTVSFTVLYKQTDL